MKFRLARLAPAVLLAAVAALTAGCASDGDPVPSNPFKAGKSERELRLEAEGLYKLARRSLDTADFVSALQRYGQIQVRYPFTEYATQAQLETIYARYRSFDPDGAVADADRFIKEHPRHPEIDYVYYLRGLVGFQRGDGLFDWMVDSAAHDVSFARKAFDDFALLLQRYPLSPYTGDARARMVHLRNRIAAHELTIVKYYRRRGAGVAAAKRAEKIISEYPGAPATLEALELLELCYRDMGMTAQADEAAKLRAANGLPAASAVAAPAVAGTAPAPAPLAATPAPRQGFWDRLTGTEADPIGAAAPPSKARAADEDFVVQPGAQVKEVGPARRADEDASPAQ